MGLLSPLRRWDTAAPRLKELLPDHIRGGAGASAPVSDFLSCLTRGRRGQGTYPGTHSEDQHADRGVDSKVVAQACLTLCDLMDCSLPGSSIHAIFQARVLEWVAISFSRGSSTQGSNPGLPHCWQTLYHLSQQRGRKTETKRRKQSVGRRCLYRVPLISNWCLTCGRIKKKTTLWKGKQVKNY